MKRCFALAILSVVLSGCKMKEFASTPFYAGDEVKYTGRVEDRVNLWPLAYWREPFGSVLWPLVSFSDDQFAIRPIYSQYRQNGRDGEFDEFNFLWPFCQADLKGDDYRIFPFFWGADDDHHAYQALFPVYWNSANYNSLFPLWIYRDSHKGKNLSLFFGMAGRTSGTNGCSANWCFPLWYWNAQGTFVTTIYGQWKNGWAMPPLFSWGTKENNGDYANRYLLGIGGEKRSGFGGEVWAFPFFSRKWWETNSSNRICRTQAMLDIAEWENRNGKAVSSHVFPLYSWHHGKSLLTPLFYWDANGSLLTPLGGKAVDNGTTNIFVTPFVRHTSGKRTGGMVFPFWSHKADNGFQREAGKLDCLQLPDDIRIWDSVITNMVWNQEKTAKDISVVSTRRTATGLYARDNTDWLVLFPWHDSVSGHLGWMDASTNSYELTRTVSRGNGLLLKYEYGRTAKYSAFDRKKESDVETSEVSFLGWLYRHKRESDLMNADTYLHHRVLWRLWNWEEKGGDVSLDVFPGFTYDSKTNGYTKASLFWRLFRYENDPVAGREADLLFIPVWR